MQSVRKGTQWLGLLICLLAVYTIAMLAVYSFPDEWIRDNVNAAIGVLEEEGNMTGGYATYFWHDGLGITDNLTDKSIYRGLLRNGRSVTDAAMRDDYARYWHGYAVILRPLMTVFSIINVRYLNMMVMFTLFVLCYFHCRRRLGAWVAFAFAAGLLMSFILIGPFCQQYCAVYMMTLFGCYGILRFWKCVRRFLPEYFIVMGSLVCFFDFLTFPVLALGYPLLLCLMLKLKEGEKTSELWKTWFVLSAVWMGAYALTWLGKALCATLLGQDNVLMQILEQVQFRTTGDYLTDHGPRPVTLAMAIEHNVDTFFIGSAIAFFGLAIIAYGVFAMLHRTDVKHWIHALPVAVVALYPFAWYFVLQNHVRMHFWMTHKILAITVFALLSYLCCVRKDGLLDGQDNKKY